MRRSWAACWLALGLLAGCYPKGDPSKPIPTRLLPAAHAPQRLLVVLPGRGDDLPRLARRDFAARLQARWPDADVLLTGLTLGYYEQGRAARRLHDEVIAPARRRGYREVWLLGISLGGMGALQYDAAYPGEVDGLVLLSPYLGEPPLQREIAAAGGVAAWQPGPVPATVDAHNYERELWRHLQVWARDQRSARHVWLVYGDRDRLGAAMPLLAPLLPPGHASTRRGGHDWDVWTPAADDVLAAVDRERAER